MLWSSPKRHRRRDEEKSGEMTVGQRTDLFEIGTDLITHGSAGTFTKPKWVGPNSDVAAAFRNPLTQAAAGFDLALSSATAPRGRKAAAGVGAVAGQLTSQAGYFIGGAAGAAIGGTVLPFFGAPIGRFVGSAVGALAGDKIARTAIVKGITKFTHGGDVNFGGNFRDSQPAYNMRQRAEQELSGAALNARRYLGQEAQLMHQ